MPNFGIIAEGDTDFAVLQNILIGYFDEDISEYINQLQPKRGQIGGWAKVLGYCCSANFRIDFQVNDFIIIHVDTDKSFELPFDVAHEHNGKKLTVEELIESVKERFRKGFESAFGDDFFTHI